MVEQLFARGEAYDVLAPHERAVLLGAIAREEDVPAGRDIVAEGERQHSSRILISGWVCRYKLLANGSRQITQIHLPGDFFDLHSFSLQVLDHAVAAITDARVACVPHSAVVKITETEPHLTRMLWLSTALDAAIHREWLTGIGRRDALGQVAHIFCELEERLNRIGESRDGRFRSPLTQRDIGDICGLTNVHVNRMLRQLREQGLIEWSPDAVRIIDRAALAELAGFDAGYLGYRHSPR